MSVGRGRWRRGRVSVYITLHNSWSCHRRERRIMVPYWSWPPLSMVRRRQPTWIRRMTITTRTTPWPGLVVVQCSGFTHRALGTLRRVVCLHNAVIFRRIVAGKFTDAHAAALSTQLDRLHSRDSLLSFDRRIVEPSIVLLASVYRLHFGKKLLEYRNREKDILTEVK